MACEILLAGFGGQGILFSGKYLAYDALLRDKEVSWLPSYGPEMRGGTANCSVIISDTPIGSPIIANPDILIAMNLPSLDRYEPKVKQGGSIMVDSSLVERKVDRGDVTAYYIPATRIASDNNLQGLANMVMLGYIMKKTGVVPFDNAEKTLAKIVPPKKQELLGLNLKAISLGYDYQ